MCALPLGYVLAGPVAAVVGTSASLWFGAVWTVASAALLSLVPAVRGVTVERAPEAPAALAP